MTGYHWNYIGTQKPRNTETAHNPPKTTENIPMSTIYDRNSCFWALTVFDGLSTHQLLFICLLQSHLSEQVF